MLDLEQKISKWRQQMLTAGIKAPVPLEELEEHLREEIERQMSLGLSEQEAFEMAVQQVGQPKVLDSEFKRSERTFMKRTSFVLIGIFGILFGTAFILPALAWYRDHGAMARGPIEGLSLGVAIVVVSLSTTVYGFKKRKA